MEMLYALLTTPDFKQIFCLNTVFSTYDIILIEMENCFENNFLPKIYRNYYPPYGWAQLTTILMNTLWYNIFFV